ncbi:MAG: sodium/proton-translocating pyrophosphatase, partial [Fimbriimonadaceae bacterium]|nr:sodium/proton-translocating pyrophosphatase [Fimbriimonadaceae bacterium]
LQTIDINSDEFAKIANFATLDPSSMTSTEPVFKSLKEVYGGNDLFFKKVESTQVVEGQASPTPTTTIYGPTTEALFAKRVEDLKAAGTQVKEVATYPAKILSKPGEGEDAEPTLYLGVDASAMEASPFELDPSSQFLYWPKPVEEVKAAGNDAFTPGAYKTASTVNLEHTDAEWWRFFICIFFGIVMAFAFEAMTDYYVSFKKAPVKEIGGVATTGPAPMIIQGFAYGMESSVFSVFAIVICLIVPLLLFPVAVFGGYLLSFYGIALVGLGLLTTTGFILAMDTFGPISDNSQGVFEMSGAGHTNAEGARRVQLLDAAGNTTKALTKGFAIATAVVAAVALFHAYVDEAKLAEIGMRLEIPQIFLGMLVGGATPFLFAAFSINAVGRAAFQLIYEVRRQFRADAGIMAGTSKPDYGRCVAIVTAAAQKELLGPGIIAIAMPVLVAFGFSIGQPTTMVNGLPFNLVGAQALGGFLAGTILSGQLLAVTLANSGGMWDNAKKLVEDGLHGGKGTEEHKAAVVCDTVGDPFKDTAGPALNPLIKVMNLIALLLAPVVIQPRSENQMAMITVAAAAALGVAIYMSKKGSLGSQLSALTAGEGGVDPAVQAMADTTEKIEHMAEEVVEKVEDVVHPDHDEDNKPQV